MPIEVISIVEVQHMTSRTSPRETRAYVYDLYPTINRQCPFPGKQREPEPAKVADDLNRRPPSGQRAVTR